MTREPGYISLGDAAAYTSMSTKTLRRRISEGKLPAYRVGRLIRIKLSDLDELFRTIPNAGTR